MNILKKKSETVVILLSAFFCAFSVNTIANVFFEHWGKSNPIIVTVIAFFILALSLFQIFRTVLRDEEASVRKITIPFTYSKIKKAFHDLPFCPLSVRIRASYDKLPQEGKDLLALYDTGKDFFDSELNRFLDQCVQEWLVTYIIGGTMEKYEGISMKTIKEIPKPQGILDNPLLKDCLAGQCHFEIPDFIAINSFGHNNCFIELNSRYGSVKFTWYFAFCTSIFHSKLVTAFDNEDHWHDFEVSICAVETFSDSGVILPGLENFVRWKTGVLSRFTESDWENGHQKRILNQISNLISKDNDTGRAA